MMGDNRISMGLDCGGPLVQCTCQPDCPGGMCARKCHLSPSHRSLSTEEREALAYARDMIATNTRACRTQATERALSALARLLDEGK